ncbi:MAG: aldo/keto reductase [Planctomycetota bacterium]
MANYKPAANRYEHPNVQANPGWFRRCGNSGLMLPAISIGGWHNFGDPGTDAGRHTDEASMHANAQSILLAAFDHGVTHIDMANNYGPPPGSAETRVGRILKEDFAGYRDELIVSSKAGYRMQPGPYGDGGSRKYLIASCEASLQRLQLDYVDIFYSHRYDHDTPLDETLGALDTLVKQGKTLYVGISSYPADVTTEAINICERNGFVKPIIHQPSYSMLDRWIEGRDPNRPGNLIETCGGCGMGMIVFCPLAQGLLTPKYLDGVPDDSRAAHDDGFLSKDRVTPELIAKLNQLNDIANDRGQSLAQLALLWALRDARVTSALIGASRASQVEQCCRALDAPALTDEELQRIEAILSN